MGVPKCSDDTSVNQKKPNQTSMALESMQLLKMSIGEFLERKGSNVLVWQSPPYCDMT